MVKAVRQARITEDLPHLLTFINPPHKPTTVLLRQLVPTVGNHHRRSTINNRFKTVLLHQFMEHHHRSSNWIIIEESLLLDLRLRSIASNSVIKSGSSERQIAITILNRDGKRKLKI